MLSIINFGTFQGAVDIRRPVVDFNGLRHHRRASHLRDLLVLRPSEPRPHRQEGRARHLLRVGPPPPFLRVARIIYCQPSQRFTQVSPSYL